MATEKPKKRLQNDGTLSSNDKDIIRLLKKQKFNDLWDLNDDIIIKLTRKSFSIFQSTKSDISQQILLSIIIIVIILETRFTT